ncbi:hypothetical protein HBN50_11155 [Halobacteriovorax sp. GB3]|uniref:hypothetical protein n=1 Tax=Halobacteriovorax sp. GB3 TaxID=2719615 RepID=UPI00236250AC|nr:hypothetical protein [Halobacteriovorax sp. GB3]MDD0853657.1 hypothetical protein [Halobacteriovorax sp. GB3]
MNKIKLTLILCLFTCSSYAREFSLAFEAKKDEVEYFQVRNEIKLLRSKKVCPDAQYAQIKRTWECRKVTKELLKCAADFICEYPMSKNAKSFDMRRLLAKMMSLPVGSSKVKTLVSANKSSTFLGNLERIDFSKTKDEQKGTFGPQELRVQKIVVEESEKEKRKENVFYLDDGKEKTTSLEKFAEENFVKKEETISEDEVQVDLNSLMGSQEEPAKDIFKEAEQVKKASKEKESKNEKSNFDFLNFTASYIQIYDGVTSLSSMDGAWTPFYWFSEQIGLRGRFGLHQFEIELSATEKERFNVIDMSAFFIFRLDHLYLEAGYGMQKWSSTISASPSVFSLGAGYYFTKPLLGYVDRLIFNYNSVSSDEGANEILLGFGIDL